MFWNDYLELCNRNEVKRELFPKKETFRSVICADVDVALLQKPKDFHEFMKILME